jgi:hypothetical protein
MEVTSVPVGSPRAGRDIDPAVNAMTFRPLARGAALRSIANFTLL